MAGWDDVRRFALALPETSEDVSRGQAHWNVRGKGFVWERPLRRSDLEALGPAAPDGPILGVRTEHLIAKEALLGSDPEVFFTTPHFDGYPAVLVRLDRIGPDELAEVVEEAWLSRAPVRTARAYVQRAALLRRIGLGDAPLPQPDLAGLVAVHRAFAGTVPFEALAAQLGEFAPLKPDRLVDRILAGGRGGYCFEVNTVLHTLLEALGFEVERREAIVAGRTAFADGELTNHLTLVVQTPGGPHIADAGLGAGLLEPIPLRAGRFDCGPFHVELERDGDGWWVGFHEHADLPGFRFSDTPVPLSAFARHHKRLATSPASGFVRVLIVQAPREDRILTLRSRTYSEIGPGVAHREVLADEAAFAAVLHERFGIDPAVLGRERVARLWARACAQHEAFVAG